MNKLIGFAVLLIVMVGLVEGWQPVRETGAAIVKYFSANADRPPKPIGDFEIEEILDKRDEYIALLRGAELGKPFDPAARIRAIDMMQAQRSRLLDGSAMSNGSEIPVLTPNWVPLGPGPIPNGGVTSGSDWPVSGRTTAFVIDPTNSNKVYLGTALGGVYRSLDGGAHWAPIFDGAYSSAIGSLALAPSDPTVLFVGTGEANTAGGGCIFAGVGIYRIDNADTTATLVGPINPVRNYVDGSGNPQSVPVFNGRSISNIWVHPSDPSIIFAGVTVGKMGIGGEWPFGSIYPPSGGILGLVRLTNATGSPSSVIAQKLTVTTTTLGGVYDTPNTGNRSVAGIIFDPSDPNILIVWVVGSSTTGDGGIYRSINAQAANPAFTHVLTTTESFARGEFAGYKQGANPTVIYAATGETKGRLRRSTDGGATWPDTSVGHFSVGGYNDIIDPNYMSPVAGRMAWTGNSAGFVTTTVILPEDANGQDVQLKRRMASDSSFAGVGVRIDTITGLLCSSAAAPGSSACDQNFDAVTTPALPAGWTSAATGAESPWVTSWSLPDTPPNSAFARDPSSVGNTELISPILTVPTNGATISFRNNYNTEESYDGMVLEISINGGPFRDIAASGGSGFCDGQCFYNIGLDVRPGDSTSAADDVIMLGGVMPFFNQSTAVPRFLNPHSPYTSTLTSSRSTLPMTRPSGTGATGVSSNRQTVGPTG